MVQRVSAKTATRKQAAKVSAKQLQEIKRHRQAAEDTSSAALAAHTGSTNPHPNYRNKAVTQTVTAAAHTHLISDEVLLCDTTSNAITVNLAQASTLYNGYVLQVKLVDATNAVTIDGYSSETIDGATTLVLSVLYSSVSLVCDGSNWHIL